MAIPLKPELTQHYSSRHDDPSRNAAARGEDAAARGAGPHAAARVGREAAAAGGHGADEARGHGGHDAGPSPARGSGRHGNAAAGRDGIHVISFNNPKTR